ncbi:uncharacterized protein LOC126833806 [Adelges cooleyi]|uniref:uncharacterized protein LOC126833806 n=1 Tax=Adelges cooleyi TaxID=133065 RepID=UPI00217FA24F|nr:uncharacterized protein LOC126833806 [Adelges cooleyi]
MDDGLHEFLLDSGVLNEMHTVIDSVVKSSVTAADLEDSDAREIAERLLELNADDIDGRLDALVRDAKVQLIGQSADGRWPDLLDFESGPRQTARNLSALCRLPFTYDTYAGPYFQRLTKGLEQCVSVDALFEPAAHVYAKLVDAAPDCETAVESFASLCEAAHLRCRRRPAPDADNTITAVCLMLRCLAVVCRRGASCKSVKPAVVEFVAAVTYDHGHDNGGVYGILCRADPTARWFDHLSRSSLTRTAFFECLRSDRRFLKTLVSGFFGWMAEPIIPKTTADGRGVDATKYAGCVHAVYLLAKMYAYKPARALFPVKASKTARVRPAAVANCCLGFLSAVRDHGTSTLAVGLRRLVAVLAAFHPEIVRAVAENGSEHAAGILAEVAARWPEALSALLDRGDDGIDQLDGLFKKKHWRVERTAEALTTIATAISGRSEGVWWLATRKSKFLEAVADKQAARQLMRNILCTPLASSVYGLRADVPTDGVDWTDPEQTLALSVICSTDRGRRWAMRTGLLDSVDGFVEARWTEATENLFEPDDDGKTIDSIVRVAQSICATTEGLQFILADGGSQGAVTRLSEIYLLTYEDFDKYTASREVLVALWLRLIQAATHSFVSEAFAESQLRYQDTLSKLCSESRTEDGAAVVDESTELIRRLRRRPVDWPERETVESIMAYGRLRFGESFTDGHDDDDDDDEELLLPRQTGPEVDGIRSALRSTVGLRLLPEERDEEAVERRFRRVYGRAARRRCPGPAGSSLGYAAVYALFLAARGSEKECLEACAVLAKTVESSKGFWPPAEDEDEKSISGHLLEGLLQKEQPEVYNAFKMSGVSWWLLCSGWTVDCFLGRLPWPEVCRWLCLVAMYPAEYRAYFFICLAAAQKRRWLEAFGRDGFRETVIQGSVDDFRLTDHADYMERLAEKHHDFLSNRLGAEFDNTSVDDKLAGRT